MQSSQSKNKCVFWLVDVVFYKGLFMVTDLEKQLLDRLFLVGRRGDRKMKFNNIIDEVYPLGVKVRN